MNGSKTVVGVDIAKRVFQLHWIEIETGEIVRLQLKREKFLEHFANRAAVPDRHGSLWGRAALGTKAQAMGHQVKLLPAKVVKPFVVGNKNDRA